jgi:hypothetical protein
MLRPPWVARSDRRAPARSQSQQRSGWDARVRPRATGAHSIVLREEEVGRLREHHAGPAAPLGFSSSAQTALIGAARKVTDLRESEAERVGGMAKLRRRQSKGENALLGLKGRSDEVITATSSARADATHRQRLRPFWLAIIPRVPGPTSNAAIVKAGGNLCQYTSAIAAPRPVPGGARRVVSGRRPGPHRRRPREPVAPGLGALQVRRATCERLARQLHDRTEERTGPLITGGEHAPYESATPGRGGGAGGGLRHAVPTGRPPRSLDREHDGQHVVRGAE